MTSAHQTMQDLGEPARKLRDGIPEVSGRQQATHAEVAEAMGVVVMMNGGPGTVSGARAFAAYREFGAKR
jgi:hypothetical protein